MKDYTKRLEALEALNPQSAQRVRVAVIRALLAGHDHPLATAEMRAKAPRIRALIGETNE